MSLQSEFLIKRIEDLIRKRSSIDRRMGYGWMLVPLLPIVVGIALAVSVLRIVISAIPRLGSVQQPQVTAPVITQILALYGFAIISLYTILIIGSVALYFIIERRNSHFKRQQLLFATFPRYLSSKANVATGESISKLSQLSEDSLFEEHDRPAGLWAILNLFVTPIVGLVVAYGLTQDLRKHDERQSDYQSTLMSAFSETSLSAPSLAPYKTHKRDPLLFLILTAITAGLFWIYWFYTLLKDYNEHFQAQAFFEDQILAALKPAPPSTVCAACGGSVPEGSKFCPFCGKPQSS